MTLRSFITYIKKIDALDPSCRITGYQNILLCFLSLIISFFVLAYILFILFISTDYVINKHHIFFYIMIIIVQYIALVLYLKKKFSKNTEVQSINDPSIVEDGWQIGNDTIYRKLLHRFLAVIAIQIALPFIVWTSLLVYYSLLWNEMLEDYREREMPTTISEALPPPIPESINAMPFIVNSGINLSSSLGMDFRDYDKKYKLGSVYRYLTDIDESQKQYLPNNLPSLSRTNIQRYFINTMSIPSIEKYVTDLEMALDKPEMDLYKSDRSSDYDIPKYEIFIIKYFYLIRYYAFSELMSGREDNAIRTLLVQCNLCMRYTFSSKELIDKMISRSFYLDTIEIIQNISGKLTKRSNIILLMNKLGEISFENQSLAMINIYQIECCYYVKYYNDPNVFYNSISGITSIDSTILFLLKPWMYKYGYNELKYFSELKVIIESNNFQTALIKTEKLKNSDHQYRPLSLSYFGIPRSVHTDFIFSFNYLETQNRMTIISLALRLYKIDNGHYPDTLDMLSPEILNIVPVDPISGLDYKYENKNEIIRLEGAKIGFIKRDERSWNTELIIKK